MSVFVDTSAILAAMNIDDIRHAAAARTWSELVESSENLVTSNYVILETLSLLQRRFGAGTARKFAEDAVPVIEIVWVDRPLHDAALVAALTYDGKRSPSIVDCVSFEIINRAGIKKAFAYDKHFEQRGFAVIG